MPSSAADALRLVRAACGLPERPSDAAAAAAPPASASRAAPAAVVGGKRARVRQQKRHSGLLAEAAPQAAPAEPPPGAEPRRRRLPSKPRPAADEAPAKGAKEAEAPRRRRKPAAANEQPAPEQQQPPAAGEPAPALTKRQKVMQFVHAKPAVVTPAAKGALSFEADWHDHCETPFEAFRDVEPLLFQLAARLGRTKATLRLYDPYYCEGSMVAHLRRLGFESVSNRNVDCYAEWASGTAPDYDVLITNPPYSGDHMPRCLRFVAASRRPWLLLLPNFVCRKRDFAATTRDCPPAYLVPQHRYVYYAPGRREEATQATSPFDSFWYLYLGPAEQADPLLAWWERKYARASGCTLARSPDALPAPVREEPRANPRARRREAKRAAFLHKEFGVARAHVRPAKAKKAKQNAAAEQQQQHPPG